MCELILNDTTVSCSSGLSVQTSVNPYLSLKPLVEVLSRGEKEPNQVNNHYTGTHRVGTWLKAQGSSFERLRFCMTA